MSSKAKVRRLPTVILIHGTFAKRAAWTQQGSAFVRELRNILGPALQLTTFEWSGRNSHVARLQAGRELSRFIELIPDRETPCVLMAHSHGGNVALYALQDEVTRARVGAVVCMNTPFLNCWLRDQLPPRVRAFLIVVATSLLLIALSAFLQFHDMPRRIGLLDRAFARLAEWGIPQWLLMGVAIVSTMTALGLLIEGIKHSFGWLDSAIHDWLARRALLRLTQLGAPMLGAPPILCLAFKRDEARGWLRGLSAIAEVPNAASGRLAALVSRWAVLTYLAGAVIVRKLVIENARVPQSIREPLEVLTGAGLFIGALLLFVLLLALPVIMVAAGLVLRGHRISFGENMVDNLIVETEATKVPGKVFPPADFMEPDLSKEMQKGWRLRHSLIYEDPYVVQVILEWLVKKQVLPLPGSRAGNRSV